jgi:hypothetical protein
MGKHGKLNNFINHFVPLKADWSFITSIREVIKNKK